MSYKIITKRIADIMQTIIGVYNVHTYFRDIPDDEEFQKAFTVEVGDKSIMTAWMMTRNSIQAERPSLDTQTIMDVTHRIEVQGFYGMLDSEASEKDFQEVIDNINFLFRTKFKLEDATGAALAGVIIVGEPQFVEIGHGQFSNYFVHFCRMLLSIQERLQ